MKKMKVIDKRRKNIKRYKAVLTQFSSSMAYLRYTQNGMEHNCVIIKIMKIINIASSEYGEKQSVMYH